MSILILSSKPHNILLLGGTEDARHLADLLIEQLPNTQFNLTYSLAGITDKPRLPDHINKMSLRQQGFGGVEKLQHYLEDIDMVIDATHPFATQISHNIQLACNNSKTPMVCYQRNA